MRKFDEGFVLKEHDIIIDNGYGVYVWTQNDRRITRRLFNQLVRGEKIFYERTQMGVDYYCATLPEVNYPWLPSRNNKVLEGK
jgi:hypothetical protein